MINISNLSKSFNNIIVLNDVSFNLNQKEIVGIIGPSGGGKTTFLKCINLLHMPESFNADYFGNVSLKKATTDDLCYVHMNDITERISDSHYIMLRKNISIVFQNFNLWPNKSVLQNITLAPRIVLGKNLDSIIDEATEFCDRFEIKEKLNIKVRDLSGGQLQRVALIRSLMMHPKVLLLDEITSALDPMLAYNVLQAIQTLRDTGISIIIVTHHIDFACMLCDKIAFLYEGKFIQIDTPSKILNSPNSSVIKDFIDKIRYLS